MRPTVSQIAASGGSHHPRQTKKRGTPCKSADPSENRAFLRFALTFDRAGGAEPAQSSRAYHDTGVSGALPKVLREFERV